MKTPSLMFGIYFILISYSAVATDYPYFITEGEGTFYSGTNGERVIKPEQIDEARKAWDSRPAEFDSDDNWGSVTNGLQTSIRLGDGLIESNQPIVATIIMRNLSDELRAFSSPYGWASHVIIIGPHGKQLERKDWAAADTVEGKAQRSAVQNTKPLWVDSRMQRKLTVDLRQFYNLDEPGIYEVHAELRAQKHEGNGSIVVSTGPASFLVMLGRVLDTNKTERNYPYFVTDDGHVSHDSLNGGRFIYQQKIREAKEAAESQPAEKDPGGNWGPTSLGCRVSLRFTKSAYSTNEPVTAMLIVRNVSADETELSFGPGQLPSCIVVKPPQGSPLHRKDARPEEANPIIMNPGYWTMLTPQMQKKFELDLRNHFDLTTLGSYIIYAQPRVFDPATRHLSKIQSGNAFITITNSPSSATNAAEPTNSK